MNFWTGGTVKCLINNTPFDFGADPDHNLDPGILAEFLPLRDKGKV